jgi:hypothetical protein
VITDHAANNGGKPAFESVVSYFHFSRMPQAAIITGGALFCMKSHRVVPNKTAGKAGPILVDV